MQQAKKAEVHKKRLYFLCKSIIFALPNEGKNCESIMQIMKKCMLFPQQNMDLDGEGSKAHVKGGGRSCLFLVLADDEV